MPHNSHNFSDEHVINFPTHNRIKSKKPPLNVIQAGENFASTWREKAAEKKMPMFEGGVETAFFSKTPTFIGD